MDGKPVLPSFPKNRSKWMRVPGLLPLVSSTIPRKIPTIPIPTNVCASVRLWTVLKCACSRFFIPTRTEGGLIASVDALVVQDLDQRRHGFVAIELGQAALELVTLDVDQ